MRKRHLLEIMLIFAAGCESSPPKSDDIVPIDQVPVNVMDIARKQLPGYTFDTIYKTKIDGGVVPDCGTTQISSSYPNGRCRWLRRGSPCD
jgi:hypothetical protein